MREVTFKNYMSKEAKKREIFMEETFADKGNVSKVLKRSMYFVQNVIHIESQEEFDGWMGEQKKMQNANKKRFHIMKIHSDKLMSDTVLCKAKGSFYVVCGKNIYNIVYIHWLRMEISKAHTTQG